MAYQFGQIFRTQPVPATLPAFYQLSIRAPGGSLLEIATYTFAISPSQLRYEPGGMSRFADVQGTAAQGNPTGVARIMDTYGLSPPMISIEGTTGWDRHQTDGYVLTGIQSIQFLQAFLQRYAALNQAQRLAGNPQLYTLEFADYFLLQFWTVEPVGPQIVRMANDQPRLTYYRFRWAATAAAGSPPLGTADAILAALGVPAAAAAATALTTLGAVASVYSASGPAVLGTVVSAL